MAAVNCMVEREIASRAGRMHRLVGWDSREVAMRTMTWTIGLTLAGLVFSGVVAAKEGPTGWTRRHCRLVDSAGEATASSYSILTGPALHKKLHRRVLLTTLAGRQLVVDLVQKPESRDGGTSRWLSFFLLPAGRHLNLALVSGRLETLLDGTALQTLNLDDAPTAAAEFAQVREMLPESLLVAIREWTRVGLSWEPRLREDAGLLQRTLLLGDELLSELPAASLRVEAEESPLSGDESPLPAEQPFGVQFDIFKH